MSLLAVLKEHDRKEMFTTSVRFPTTTIEKVDALCRQHQVTRTSAINLAVERLLEQEAAALATEKEP